MSQTNGHMQCAPTITVLLFVFVLLFVKPTYAISVDVTDISNRAYYDATFTELNNAKQEIDVAMYALYAHKADAAIRPITPPALFPTCAP